MILFTGFGTCWKNTKGINFFEIIFLNSLFKLNCMLQSICPKLPMREKSATKNYYLNQLGFEQFGSDEFPDYLMVKKENIEIHFFLFKELDPKENYGQVYIRVENIESLYQSYLDQNIAIHPNGKLKDTSWGMKEFHLLDPDNNLLTFGEII